MDQVNSFLKVLESTNGRDKLGKLLQYSGRFFAWYFTAYHPNDALAKKATGINKNTALARKLTRLLKWLPLLIKAETTIRTKFLQKKPANLDELTALVSSLGYANYFFWDNLVWFERLGVIKGNSKYSKLAMYGWFFGILFALLGDSIKLYYYLNDQSDFTEKQRNDLKKKFALNYAKNLSDFCIASTGIQLHTFNEGFLGVCGCIAALVGFHELWPKS